MTQVEKKAQPYLPFIPISGNSLQRKSTLEVHGTVTDPHYGISPMWGSSLGPGGPQPYTLTKPCHSLLFNIVRVCTQPTSRVYSVNIVRVLSQHRALYSANIVRVLSQHRTCTQPTSCVYSANILRVLRQH